MYLVKTDNENSVIIPQAGFVIRVVNVGFDEPGGVDTVCGCVE